LNKGKVNPPDETDGDTAFFDYKTHLTCCYNERMTQITIADSAHNDAFGRLRVSNPFTVFDSKQVFDNTPLRWSDGAINGTNTTSVYTKAEASTVIGVTNAKQGTRVRQTFQRFNYQPAKSQLLFITFAGIDTVAGITKRVGLFDASNGLFLQSKDGDISFVNRTGVSGTVRDNVISRLSWNLDYMDGNGPSKIRLDFTKAQIMIIDFEWLGVGRVRFGFVVDGKIYYAHQMLNTNVVSNVYMSTPNLPIRYEIANDGTGPTSTLKCICSSLISEGGSEPQGLLFSTDNGVTKVDANVIGTTYALLGIRLKQAYIGAIVDLLNVETLTTTVTSYKWSLLWNPTVAGTFTYEDITNSACQRALGATANEVTGGVQLDSGYVSSSAQAKGASSEVVNNALHLGADINNVVDTLVLAVTPIDVNADIFGSMAWREII